MNYNLYELLRNDNKVYVDVIEIRKADGTLIPKIFTWTDGEKYRIDEIQDVRRAASLKAGGAGIRYTVRVGERITYMFLEGDRWFMSRDTG